MISKWLIVHWLLAVLWDSEIKSKKRLKNAHVKIYTVVMINSKGLKSSRLGYPSPDSEEEKLTTPKKKNKSIGDGITSFEYNMLSISR